MHSVSISSSGALQATTIEQPPLAEPTASLLQHERVKIPSSIHSGIFRTTAKETNLVWYRGFFGSVEVQFKSTSLSTSTNRRPEKTATSEERIIKITLIFLRKILELRFLNSFGRMSRTLKTYPILPDRAPIFQLCMEGDIQGLQVALSSGTVSPFVLSKGGFSLLQVSPWPSR